MDPQKIRLLALDMDGTTYYRMGTIIKANIKPLQAVLKANIELVFVTGRPVLSNQNALKEHGLATNETLIIGYNGGCIYDLGQHKALKINPLTAAQAQAVFELAQAPRYQGIEIFGYVDNFKLVITNQPNPQSPTAKSISYGEEMRFFDGQYQEYLEVKNHFDYQFFKLLAFKANFAFCQEVETYLGLTLSTSDYQDVEINAPGVNKAMALAWFAQRQGIPPQAIMAIGDGANDLSMIKFAGYGVSLANSIPAIKAAAQIHIPLTNEEGGVAYAVNKYLLHSEPQKEEK